MDFGSFPLFGPPCTWKSSEEVSLLEAVELYSYGNWGDISVYIPNKTTEEIKQHFVDYYINGHIGEVTWDLVKDKKSLIKDHSGQNGDTLLTSSLAAPLIPISELTTQQQQQLGYMPKRDDFEREYDNEAEGLVATLSMNIKDEDELDREMKLAYIDIYNRRLTERFRRKEIVRKYDLVDLFYKNSANEESFSELDTKNHSKLESVSSSISQNRNNLPKRKTTSPVIKATSIEDNKLEENLRIFSQFMNKSELMNLYEDLKRAKELKTRVKELIRYRRNGITKLSEVSDYENARGKRDKKKENKKKLEVTTENIGSARKAIVKRSPDREKGAKISSNRNTSPKISGHSRSEIISKDSKVSSLDHSDRKGEKEGRPVNIVDAESPQSEIISVSSDRGKFDASLMPGSRLLSEREKKLCTSIKLKPTQYISLKTLMLKEHLKKVNRSGSKSMLENIDKSVRRKVFNFCTKNGWICE